MRYLLVIVIILFLSILASANCDCSKEHKLLKDIELIIEKSKTPKTVPVKELAPAILKTAIEHGIRPTLLAKVIMHESRGIAEATNGVDFGLMQLNKHTMRARGISMRCALNWRCNLEAGAKYMSELQDLPSYRLCTYNLGPKGRFKRYLQMCLKYEQKVAAL